MQTSYEANINSFTSHALLKNSDESYILVHNTSASLFTPKCRSQMSENGSRNMKLIDPVDLGSAHHHHVPPPCPHSFGDLCVAEEQQLDNRENIVDQTCTIGRLLYEKDVAEV